jgi:hypothetical protein
MSDVPSDDESDQRPSTGVPAMSMRDIAKLKLTQKMLETPVFDMAGYTETQIKARKDHHELRGKQVCQLVISKNLRKCAALETHLRKQYQRELADVSKLSVLSRHRRNRFGFVDDVTKPWLVFLQVGYDKANCLLLAVLAQLKNLPANMTATEFRRMLIHHMFMFGEDLLEIWVRVHTWSHVYFLTFGSLS